MLYLIGDIGGVDMSKNLLKERMDYLFLKVYGVTLDEMDLENETHEEIILGIDSLENFYDNSYTYFILPSPYDLWEYKLYRVIGSGKHGFTVEDLGYIESYHDTIIDKDGKCHWKGYKEGRFLFEAKVKVLKEKYGFDGLYHYTDFSNLRSIFKSGYLKSRNECEYTNMSFFDSASKSVLMNTSHDVKECVRFYYRPKSPTLYVNEGIKLKEYMDKSPHLPIPVCLVFDEELIYLDTTKFADRNAACSTVIFGYDFEFFYNMDWDKIFSNYYYNDEWKNKMQAELLSTIPVSLDYLKKIIFRCETDMKRAINLFGEDDRYTVDLSVFSDKNIYYISNDYYYNNFIKNYEIMNLKEKLGINMLLLSLEFQKYWQSYIIDILIKDNAGSIKKIITFDSKAFNKTSDYNTITCIIDDFDLDFNKLEVYLNDILSVEENLEKYR